MLCDWMKGGLRLNCWTLYSHCTERWKMIKWTWYNKLNAWWKPDIVPIPWKTSWPTTHRYFLSFLWVLKLKTWQSLLLYVTSLLGRSGEKMVLYPDSLETSHLSLSEPVVLCSLCKQDYHQCVFLVYSFLCTYWGHLCSAAARPTKTRLGESWSTEQLRFSRRTYLKISCVKMMCRERRGSTEVLIETMNHHRNRVINVPALIWEVNTEKKMIREEIIT